jgi:hypothetical protein
MKRLLTTLSLMLTVLIGSTGVSYALPFCPGSYNPDTWTNCFASYTFSSGAKYVGEWKDHRKNGQGTLTFANGNKYVGQWKSDKRHGRGAFTFANGEKYVGEYKNNKRHGRGTFTHISGMVEEGIWEDNKFLYIQKVNPTLK